MSFKYNKQIPSHWIRARRTNEARQFIYLVARLFGYSSHAANKLRDLRHTTLVRHGYVQPDLVLPLMIIWLRGGE